MSVSKPASLPLDERSVSLLRRLVRDHVRRQSGRLAVAVVMMMLGAGSQALLAWLMKPVINDVFINRNATALYLIAGTILATFTVKGLAAYFESVLMNRVGQRIIADMQRRLIEHLVHADLAFFHANPTGTLVSRFTNDVNLLRGAVSNTLTNVGKDFLGVVFLFGVMMYQDWLLTLVALVGFPTAILPIARVGKRMRRVSASNQVEIGQFTTLLEQVFQGARHVKAYGMEQYEASRAGQAIERLFRLATKAGRVRAISSPIMETLGGVAIVAVILYGGSQVIAGARDTGTFFSYITALLLAYEPIKRLANLNVNLQEGLAAAQRIFALLDEQPRIKDAAAARPLAIAKGEVAFRGVSFGYSAAIEALRTIDLVVPAGRTAALVGPSGAGKSTILNLIPRFYDVDSGAVAIDGQDVRGVTLTSLRGAIALVSQEVSLFDDTVRANIAYGRPGAAEADVAAAATAAAAHEFILRLPQGYDTPVGELGVKLSGGQRQRLAIARAMLKDAPILLLDEATSSLDSESERQVQAALKRLMRGRTTLVIAHRLSTVVDADLIYVIDQGRVVEQGSHAELLARDAAYARLYRLQFQDQQPSDLSPAFADGGADGAERPKIVASGGE
jgi:subfamily B ATP-binding cassette protein MsbA